jgi:hypothetical protein
MPDSVRSAMNQKHRLHPKPPHAGTELCVRESRALSVYAKRGKTADEDQNIYSPHYIMST